MSANIIKRKEDYKDYILKMIRTKGRFNVDDSIIGEKEMKLIFQAFTHRTTDESNNYENFETVGDKSYNMITLYYISRRFPELWNFYDAKFYLQESSKHYQSKIKAPILADELQLMNYIIVGESFLKNESNLDKLKTDCLESLLYLITKIINDHFGEHVGYGVIYNIIETCFDNINNMPIDPSLILNSKVKLKEILERYFKKDSKDKDNYYDKFTLKDTKYNVRIVFTKPYPFNDGYRKELIFDNINEALDWFESKGFIWTIK